VGALLLLQLLLLQMVAVLGLVLVTILLLHLLLQLHLPPLAVRWLLPAVLVHLLPRRQSHLFYLVLVLLGYLLLLVVLMLHADWKPQWFPSLGPC
jgi:hypothetical protein